MKKIFTILLLFALIITGYRSIAQTDLVYWTFPVSNSSVATGGIASNSTKVISTTATGTITYVLGVGGAGDTCISSTGWDAGMDAKYWEIEFTTLGYTNILLSSKQRSSNTGPKDFKAQYKVGSSGTWTDITGGSVTAANNFTTGVLTDVALPVETENQVSVSVRWIMTSDISVNASTVSAAGTSRMDDLYIKGSQITTPAAEILTFDIPNQISSVITSGSGTVDIVMPFGTNVTSLIPAITLSSGATISPLSGVAQDFSTSVVYVVTASDAITTKNWTVNVTLQAASTEAEILTFNIPTQISSTINSVGATVDVIMPLGTDVTLLIPTITTSLNSTISPNSGVVQDFTNTITYIVTAEDGSTFKSWNVNVSVQANTEAEIITFDIPSQISSLVTSGAGTVDIVMPFGTNVTNLVPAITLSQGATVSPLTGVSQDFTSPVVYIVTAEDGSTTKSWTVTVMVQPGSSEAEILTFDIPGQDLSGVNSVNGTVSVTMPAGTDVTNLTPSISISMNASILPNTGVSQDFTLPVIYVVTAEDGTQKNWTVTVIVAQTTLVEWNFPNNPDDNMADGGITANLSKLITTTSTGTITYASSGITTNSISSTGWDAGMDTKYWEIEFTTAGYTDISLTSKQRASNTGPRDWKIQYKIGTSGIWTDVPGANIIDSNDWAHGVYPETILPVEIFDQPSVYIRWIMTSDLAVNLSVVGASGTSRIDDIIVKGSLITNTEESIYDRSDFILFPNPATDVVNVIFSNTAPNANIEIISIDGKTVINKQLQNNMIQLNGIESGLYFVRVSNTIGVRKLFIK